MDSSWNLLVIGPHVDWIHNNKKCVYTILFYSISGVKIEGAKSGWHCKISALALFFFGLPSKKPLASRHKKSLYSKTIYTTKQDLGMKPTASGGICIQYFHIAKRASRHLQPFQIVPFSNTGLNFKLSFRRLSCAKKNSDSLVKKILNSLILSRGPAKFFWLMMGNPSLFEIPIEIASLNMFCLVPPCSFLYIAYFLQQLVQRQ